MKKLWLFAMLGVLLGAAGVQTAHLISARHSRDLFEQRLRCKALADKYVQGLAHNVVVRRVEFSRSRSSCIASTFEQSGLDAATEAQLGLKPSADFTYVYKVVDILTEEELMTRTCTSKKIVIGDEPECTNSLQKQDEAFEEAR